MRPIILFLLLAASLTAQTAAVEGTVVDQSTGQPISDVHVRVLTGDVATLTVERVYGAMSDRAGHFSIAGIRAGLYLIVPEKIGFVFVRTPGIVPVTVLALKAGQHITGQKVEMVASGFVSGHVVDDAGDPVPGASLRLLAAPPDTDFVNPFAVPLPNYTDDHGEFRMVVAPGKYYLQSSPGNYMPPMETRPGVPPVPYVATYYPNAPTVNEASPIQVKPGQEAGALEIRLAHSRQPAPGGGGTAANLSLGGVVTGSPEGMRATIVVLRSMPNGGPMQTFRGFVADGEGKFLVRGMPPGTYKVIAQAGSGMTALQSQPVEVQLSGADNVDLRLRLSSGEDLGGSVAIAGEEPGAAPAPRIAVKLESLEAVLPGAVETPAATVNKDGTFRIGGIFAGHYRVRVDPMPAGTFLRSVTLDGAPVDDAGFNLSGGGPGDRLKITLSRNAGEISGSVLGQNGLPVNSPLAQILVWKDTLQVRPEHNTVDGSRYVLRNLRPGKYRILAVDAYDFTNLAGANTPDEFAKALRAASEEIEIKEGARVVKDLKVAAKEDVHVQPKQ